MAQRWLLELPEQEVPRSGAELPAASEESRQPQGAAERRPMLELQILVPEVPRQVWAALVLAERALPELRSWPQRAALEPEASRPVVWRQYEEQDVRLLLFAA